jgi:hypothetical protein
MFTKFAKLLLLDDHHFDYIIESLEKTLVKAQVRQIQTRGHNFLRTKLGEKTNFIPCFFRVSFYS